MMEKMSWKDFRDNGMLWVVNNILHIFGLAITVEVDDETGEIVNVYPIKTNTLGFKEEVNVKNYDRVKNYLRR